MDVSMLRQQSVGGNCSISIDLPGLVSLSTAHWCGPLCAVSERWLLRVVCGSEGM